MHSYSYSIKLKILFATHFVLPRNNAFIVQILDLTLTAPSKMGFCYFYSAWHFCSPKYRLIFAQRVKFLKGFYVFGRKRVDLWVKKRLCHSYKYKNKIPFMPNSLAAFFQSVFFTVLFLHSESDLL